MGRTYRKRRRKYIRSRPQCVQDDEKYITLLQWMSELSFVNKSLIPAIFSSTGRGLMTKCQISAGDLVVSIPKTLLITHETVRDSEELGHLIESYALKPVEAICLFLLFHYALGEKSRYFHYVRTLPEIYDNVAYFDQQMIDCLQSELRERAQKQNDTIESQFVKLEPIASEIANEFSVFSGFYNRENHKWAWSTINSRSVHMEDGCALAPFLDFLNHSNDAKINAAFNPKTQCYEIRTLDTYKKFDQVFICYGQHDNSTLMLEYGFIIVDNDNDTVPVYLTDLERAAKELCGNIDRRKLDFIRENLCETLNFSSDGPSWNLTSAIRILASEVFDFRNRNLYLSTIPEVHEKGKMEPHFELILNMKKDEISKCIQRTETLGDNYRCFMIRSFLNQQMRILERQNI